MRVQISFKILISGAAVLAFVVRCASMYAHQTALTADWAQLHLTEFCLHRAYVYRNNYRI